MKADNSFANLESRQSLKFVLSQQLPLTRRSRTCVAVTPVSAGHVFTLLWFSILNEIKFSCKSGLVLTFTLIFKVIQLKMAY